jgi:molybdopterin/thiamine biosynthesis adenylyltransferase
LLFFSSKALNNIDGVVKSLKYPYHDTGDIMTRQKISELLHIKAKEQTRPDKTSYYSLFFADECAIAEKTNMSLLEVECAALSEDILPQRYSRNQKSLSNADQLKLLQSHIAIIGLGGLGGTVTEILARIGVGSLTLVDGDSFDESNLNRQILSSPALLGVSKAKTAQNRVKEINPAVNVISAQEFLTKSNSTTLLSDAQLAVDCLDTIAARFVLEEACKSIAIPLISAAIGGSNGQATVIFPEDPGLQLIYGRAENTTRSGIEATLGTLPYAAMYMAAVQCAEATTILLGKPSELKNKLFLADVQEHTTDLITFKNENP